MIQKLYDDYISGEGTGGRTPLALQLREAKKYLDDHKATDTAKECRKKFIVLITDGWDTLACKNNSSADEYTSRSFGYKRRRATVAAVKAAIDAGYQVFVIGFGYDMPPEDKNTLSWVALKGGTDNPNDADSGDTSAITFASDPCEEYAGCSPDQANCTNAPNDPGYKNLSGYAFLASDGTALAASLKDIFKYIREKAFSFTAPTVPTVRLTEGQRVYISSFAPNTTPFWRGDLKAYTLNADGTLPVNSEGFPTGTPVWEAQKILETTSPDSRKIYTYKSGRVDFTQANIKEVDLGISINNSCIVNSDCDKLIKHVRGYDAWDIDGDGNTTESRKFKLGDIFHSQAMIVGAPSIYFVDAGYSGTGGFYDTKKNRTKVIIAGANDGMLHAFDAQTGVERWAFIPPDLLTSLKLMKDDWEFYKINNSTTRHLYHVDTSPKVRMSGFTAARRIRQRPWMSGRRS